MQVNYMEFASTVIRVVNSLQSVSIFSLTLAPFTLPFQGGRIAPLCRLAVLYME